jgi:solute carrier family 31 (copper transporter), member 1
MLWNWNTIDACWYQHRDSRRLTNIRAGFLAPSWHVRSQGAFAASCIGVALLAASIEFLRRVGKEYDTAIMRQFQRNLAARTADSKTPDNSECCAPENQVVIFRATPLQQLIRSIIHAVTFGVAYLVMLLGESDRVSKSRTILTENPRQQCIITAISLLASSLVQE